MSSCLICDSPETPRWHLGVNVGSTLQLTQRIDMLLGDRQSSLMTHSSITSYFFFTCAFSSYDILVSVHIISVNQLHSGVKIYGTSLFSLCFGWAQRLCAGNLQEIDLLLVFPDVYLVCQGPHSASSSHSLSPPVVHMEHHCLAMVLKCSDNILRCSMHTHPARLPASHSITDTPQTDVPDFECVCVYSILNVIGLVTAPQWAE